MSKDLNYRTFPEMEISPVCSEKFKHDESNEKKIDLVGRKDHLFLFIPKFQKDLKI